jgi:putative transposase
VPNGNPFSESQFKTMKYRPDFPKSFDTIVQGRDFCQHFFAWHNRITVTPGSVGIPQPASATAPQKKSASNGP